MPSRGRWTVEKDNDLRKAFLTMGNYCLKPLPRKQGMLGIYTVKGGAHVGSIPAHPSLLRRTLEVLMEQARSRGVRKTLPRHGVQNKRPPRVPPPLQAPALEPASVAHGTPVCTAPTIG